MNAPMKQRPAPKSRPAPGQRPTGVKFQVVRPAPNPAATPAEPEPAPVAAAEEVQAFSPAALQFEGVASTQMFNTLGSVRALAVREASSAIVRRSIAEARGYSDSELFALAEIGYHYFRNGGLKLAQVIFEGLMAIKPSEPYFCLATGLARDYLGDKDGAKQAYREAGRLDAGDARPELNLAELALESGDRRTALLHLARALQKAEARGDQALVKKSKAVLSLVR